MKNNKNKIKWILITLLGLLLVEFFIRYTNTYERLYFIIITLLGIYLLSGIYLIDEDIWNE